VSLMVAPFNTEANRGLLFFCETGVCDRLARMSNCIYDKETTGLKEDRMVFEYQLVSQTIAFDRKLILFLAFRIPPVFPCALTADY